MYAVRCILLVLLMAGGLLPARAAAQEPAAEPLTDVDKLYGLSLLWQEVNYNFAFFDQVPGLDWDSAYRTSIPRVLQTTSTWDYYRELQRLVALLRDGHTGVWMPQNLQSETFRRDTYPWVLTHNVEGKVVVRAVGQTLAERLPVHSVITEINGLPAITHAQEMRLPYIAQSTEHYRLDIAMAEALHGPADEPVTIRFTTPAGTEHDLELNRDRRTREDQWVPDVNVARPAFELRWLDDDVAYVALNTFADTMTAHLFEAALPDLRRARALILDVRRNGGGNSGIGYRVARWITNDTLETSLWRTREHRAAFKAWGAGGAPRYQPYAEMDAWHDGGSHGRVAPASGERIILPTVVLQDHETFSAAEDFLVVVDAIPHVRTLGRPSGGSTGQPLIIELPGGGGARIVTKRDTYPDGRDFVGVGALPDIFVERTLTDLRAGRDGQLQAALQLIRSGW